jgi:hypothetical protein
VGAIASGSQPTHQAGFGATLEGREQGQRSGSLQRVTEGAA